jgi:hypothetical protein
MCVFRHLNPERLHVCGGPSFESRVSSQELILLREHTGYYQSFLVYYVNFGIGEIT